MSGYNLSIYCLHPLLDECNLFFFRRKKTIPALLAPTQTVTPISFSSWVLCFFTNQTPRLTSSFIKNFSSLLHPIQLLSVSEMAENHLPPIVPEPSNSIPPSAASLPSSINTISSFLEQKDQSSSFNSLHKPPLPSLPVLEICPLFKNQTPRLTSSFIQISFLLSATYTTTTTYCFCAGKKSSPLVNPEPSNSFLSAVLLPSPILAWTLLPSR